MLKDLIKKLIEKYSNSMKKKEVLFLQEINVYKLQKKLNLAI